MQMNKNYDTLTCSECKTSLQLPWESPLGRYQENWKRLSEKNFIMLMPPLSQSDIGIPRLFWLYEDCYHCLLTGRYNATIVLMGVLLEAIMKERLHLKLGSNFDKLSYGKCLKKIIQMRFMEINDIKFLLRFKNKVRDVYQHSNETEITKGLSAPILAFEFKGPLTIEKIQEANEGARSGRLKPTRVSTNELPFLKSIVKQKIDETSAISLFNEVYQFLVCAKMVYFKEDEFQEHTNRFGNHLGHIKHHRLG